MERNMYKYTTTMATYKAWLYSNLFMGEFKWDILQIQKRLPLVWWRQIEIVFAIWTHSESALNEFIHDLNHHHHTTVKFTTNCSAKEVPCLDAKVYLSIETDLYDETTSKHQCLHKNSSHLKCCKTAFPFNQIAWSRGPSSKILRTWDTFLDEGIQSKASLTVQLSDMYFEGRHPAVMW